jgi:2-polyprenyl-6-hydroxyphenyl methylase/3-demethylubiquinone-9 3-methyltransferase
MSSPTPNVDPAELAKFSALAHRWWDPTSEFRPLHEINPLRLEHIARLAGGLEGKRVVDVGCGGGILAEAMAAKGASVTGIDLADKPLKVAQLHALEGEPASVSYRLVAAEDLAREMPGQFDAVTCMEMLEHVPDPAAIVGALAALAKPGGQVVVSTINRTPRAYALAVVGAEYLLRLLPRGTHTYEKFIRPSELSAWARHVGLDLADVAGLAYDPFSRRAALDEDARVNYLMRLRKPALSTPS